MSKKMTDDEYRAFCKIVKYQIVAAYCFYNRRVHLSSYTFNTAQETLNKHQEVLTEAEKWKAEGSTVFETQLFCVKEFGGAGHAVDSVSVEQLQAYAEEEDSEQTPQTYEKP